MLDENLPAFFLKPSSTGIKHHRDVYSSHHGSDPAPTYTLQYLDPNSSQPTHKNCYAAALFDAYSPDVLFGEVLARPGWTQPTLSAEELRKNGGVPPPPQPVLPHEFVIQLYEPDQQIRVEVKEGKWGGSQTYEFTMPIHTFRTPSASNIDRGQSDPASLAITPKLQFVWKRESKLSKDLTCFMTGRSTDTVERKKLLGGGQKKDPDIAVALWRGLREMTVYESNVSRLEIEDPKGLEVVLLLGAVVIRDLFFSTKEQVREVFNVSDVAGERKLSGGGRKLSNPNQTNSLVGVPSPLAYQPPSDQRFPTPNDERRNSLPKLQTGAPPRLPQRHGDPQPPPMPDPRAQWQLDAETARLQKEAKAENRRAAEERRRREKADEAEARRLQKLLEAEEKAIEKETERLRKQYGVQQVPSMPPRPQQPPPIANSSNPRQGKGKAKAQPSLQPIPQGGLAPPSSGFYGRPSASASSVMMSGGNGNASVWDLGAPGEGGQAKKKKSFFGLRSLSDDGTANGKLKKKSSSMW